MAFDFFKRLFGQNEKPETSKPTHKSTQQSTVSVPESVLDRFLINAPQFFYYDNETGDLLFVSKGAKDVDVTEKNPVKLAPAILCLFWLRDIAHKNRTLYISIIDKFSFNIKEASESEMHDFLWQYFRTGRGTNMPQLAIFYKRGKGIVNFLDAMTNYGDILLTEKMSKETISRLDQKYGRVSDLSSIADIDNSTLAQLIYRFYNDGSQYNPTTSRQPEKKEVIPSSPKTNGVVDAYLLVFSAEWCGPSRRFKKELLDGGVNNFTYIDVDKHNELSDKYRILSVPTTILVSKSGDVIKKWVGYDDEDPGQSKLIAEVKSGKYRITIYPGYKPYVSETQHPQPTKPKVVPETKTILSSPIKKNVDDAICAFESGNIPYLQDRLFHLVSQLNKPGSGKLITSYPEKDRLCECFSLCLRYDWMHDSDIREVWAENGLYCIIAYLVRDAKTPQDKLAGGLNLFLHIQYGKTSLVPKVSDILRKAQMRCEPFFDQTDYIKGVNYVLKQFLYFGATYLKPYATQALSGENLVTFNNVINDPAMNSIQPYKIMIKAKFISGIIESILNDM